MTDGRAILKARNIHKSYRMGTTHLSVLNGVDLEVRSGEFVAVVGPSGSGKSTLLHILGALDEADGGFVEFDGNDISHMLARARDLNLFVALYLYILALSAAVLWILPILGYAPWSPSFLWPALLLILGLAALAGAAMLWEHRIGLNKFRNEKVGFVFQFYHLLDELSVLENVYLPAMVSSGVLGWLTRRHSAKKRAVELLGRLGLAERARHKPYQLSGGERQRVAIGRALMSQPALLLADEPTGNLDSATGSDILKLLEELNRAGQTIVMVTHDEKVAHMASRAVTLADGKISV